jgi:hypothetical protein
VSWLASLPRVVARHLWVGFTQGLDDGLGE